MTQVIGVKFTKDFSNRIYSYLFNDSINIGDHVVVDSPQGGYKVCKVVNISDVVGKATKYAVCRVNDENYKQQVERLKRKAEIEKEIDLYAARVDKEIRYQVMEKMFPEAKALLKEFRSL